MHILREMDAGQLVERRELIEFGILERVAPTIRSAAHPLRLRILDFLSRAEAPRCVGEIVAACGSSGQAKVSQQLRILKDQRLLRARRTGTHVLYEIADPAVAPLLACIRSSGARCDDSTEQNTPIRG